MATEQQQPKTDPDTSLTLAITMALLRSKLLQKPAPPPPQHHPSSSSTSESNALKWKRKAKDRKQELLRLREDLKQAEDNSQCDLLGQSANCKCYFFDNLGKLSPSRFSNDSDGRFNDVLRRRFLRQVRLNERRRKRESSKQAHCFSDCGGEDEIEQLRASVDFLLELCDTVNPVKVEETKFLNWSHQAVDFILELHHLDADLQFRIQHLIRNLGSECYVGQRVILSVSQRIAVLGESLLFIDPFDDAFPNMHDCMYMMIQLIEFLVSDYLLTWSSNEVFDTRLLEEGVVSILHAKKALELLEGRNGLYVLYMDRVIGDLGKKLGQISSIRTLNPDILANLLC